MKELYNSTIIEKVWVHRPLDMKKGEKLTDLVDHQEVLVTLESGEKYLIHILPGSKAVITEAKNMSSKWTVSFKAQKCKVSVAKVMKIVESLGVYSLLLANCYHIAFAAYQAS